MSFAWREIVQHMIDEVNYLESASQGLSRVLWHRSALIGFDHGIVWDVVTIRVPLLRVQLEKLSDAAS